MLREAIVVAVLAGFGCTESASRGDQGRSATPGPGLVLNERASWPLQSPENLTGAAIGDRGNVIVWTANGGLLFFSARSSTGQPIPSVPSDVAGVVATGADSRPGFIAVSRTDGALWRVFPPDRVAPMAFRCDVLGHATAVVSAGSAYWTIEPEPRSAGNRIALVRLVEGTCELMGTARVDCPREQVSVAPAPSPLEAIVACADPERALMAVSFSDGAVHIQDLLESVPPEPAAGPPSSALEPLWFGLPILRVRGGFLRVVTDLRSDLRRFERWNDAGRPVATTVVRSPLGLMASNPEAGLLLGLRADQSGHRLVLFEIAADADSGG